MSPSENGRRGDNRRLEGGSGRMCRACRAAPALPGEDTCGPCGDRAIERARASVDAWITMDAERVRELERAERERGTQPGPDSAAG
jgi:hypothetical protein